MHSARYLPPFRRDTQPISLHSVSSTLKKWAACPRNRPVNFCTAIPRLLPQNAAFTMPAPRRSNLAATPDYRNHRFESTPFTYLLFTYFCFFIQLRTAALRLIVRSWLDVPTFATRRLHACHHARAPSGGRRKCG